MPQSKTALPVQRRRRPKRDVSSGAAHEDAAQYHQKAIGRALDVLESFSDERPDLNLKDLSAIVELPESSLFRILVTLESKGYLTQNADGSYRLPPKLLLGRIQERAERVKASLRPHLQALASRFNETASAAYLFEDRIQALDAVESYHEFRMTNKPGRVLPPHCSSLGKAITAFQDPARIDRLLEGYGLYRRTGKTIVDRQQVLAEFERIRTQGFAVDREETVLGGLCIGAPVMKSGLAPMAAISVSTPLVRMTPEREIEISRAVLETAQRAAVSL